MNTIIFENIYKNLKVPVFVCRNTKDYPLVYANDSAKLLVNPQYNIESMKSGSSHGKADIALALEPPGSEKNLFELLVATGSVTGFKAQLLNYENKRIPMLWAGNWLEMEGEEFFVLYTYNDMDASPSQHLTSAQSTNILASALTMALNSINVDDTINQVLALVGNSVNVSRTYIFEDISPACTSNTYEWCNTGVQPAIQDLQNLRKDEYNYDLIVNSGMYITDDVSVLPENDRNILEAQGICSIAILPLIQKDKPLGYVGFDDCEHPRKWSSPEINLLQNTANILVSLLARRNTETETARTLNILQTITDNIDSIIYVNDVKTHELVFMNKALTDSLELGQQEPLGQFCWQTLQKAQSGPCSFCPMNQMLDDQYNVVKTPLTWEFQNTKTGKWYLIKDDIIKWIDGRDVHIETATEITSQKIYEQELQQYAAFDMMTGAYNREWGSRQLQALLSNRHALETQNNSLVFIDINDLKLVNDTYGHDVGDSLIRETVNIIRSCVRKVDVLCRWGGDEFVLILRCGEDPARRIMSDVCKKMDDINAEGQKQYRLSISYGVTPLDASSTDLETVVARADRLMYESKMQYRSPIEQ